MPITNPDWIPPIEMTFDVGKPIRSEQGIQLAGNPIAIAEAASGAPRVRSTALVLRRVATFSASSVSLSEIEFTGLPGMSAFYGEIESITVSGAADAFQPEIQVSNNNGSTYTAWFAVGAMNAPGPEFGFLSDVTVLSYGGIFTPFGVVPFTGLVNAFKFRVPGMNITGVTNLNVICRNVGYST